MEFNPVIDALPIGLKRDKTPQRRYVVNYEDETVKTCLTFYRKLPWLRDEIDQILVHPINLSQMFYHETPVLEHEGLKFHSVKYKYYILRCFGEIISITDDGTLKLKYDNKYQEFKVGIKQITGVIVIQNREMFLDEKQFISNWNMTDIDVPSLKNAPVSKELLKIAEISLNGYTTEIKTQQIINTIENSSRNAYEFANKISLIITAIRYGNTFKKKLDRDYYNLYYIDLVSHDELFEGVEYDLKIDEYIEDSTNNMLISAFRYNEVDVSRKYTRRKTKTVPILKKIDVKLKCANIQDIHNIEDERLIFDKIDDEIYCYDVIELNENFKNENFINKYTGETFDESFIQKVKNLYKFSETLSSIDEYPTVSNENKLENQQSDETYNILLEYLREEIKKLNITEADICKVCGKNIGIRKMSTVDVTGGDIINTCSKICFDKL